MIRQLTEHDREEVLQFVGEKPAENLFIIGDLEMYGFDQPIQTLWGQFDETDRLKAVLLRYRENYIPYAPGDFDAKGFAEIMNADETFQFLSGLEEVVTKIQPYLIKQTPNPRVLYYAKCESAESLKGVPDEIDVKKATADDAEGLIAQMRKVPEFEHAKLDVESKRHSLETGFGRSYYIEIDGEMVSSASTTAENSQSAMIVGVGTNPEHQKKKLATYCMSVLCQELLNEGKLLCLFYDNPAAGVIYKRIGFEDIGKWCMWKMA